MTDEQITAKVAAMADAATKRAAVKAKFGDEAVKDASDAEIAGMYRVIGDAKDDTARKTIADMKSKEAEKKEPWAGMYNPKKGAK